MKFHVAIYNKKNNTSLKKGDYMYEKIKVEKLAKKNECNVL